MESMPDQANELRILVQRAVRDQVRERGPAPRLVVVSGGKGGVGTTTMAVNVSVALAEQGARVVLVDADMHRADVAMLCGVAERGDLADVLSLRRDIHEVLVRGPGGIQLVPGLWAPNSRENFAPRQQERLLTQLQSLGKHVDLVLIDAGCGVSESSRTFWGHADRILMVTTADAYSVMDTYATIKLLADAAGARPISLLVNQQSDITQAVDVHRRLDQSCRRFLGRSVEWLGHIPQDAAVAESARQTTPFAIHSRQLPAGLAIEQVAMRLLGTWQENKSRDQRAA
jgi:flagellar biosynthesis protein FlhG